VQAESFRTEKLPHFVADPNADAIGQWLSANTGPDEELFVWGFRGDLHTNAARWPASRFVYSIYLSGAMPWYDAPRELEARWAVPGSHQMLIGDLEAAHAAWIVDDAPSLMGRSMRDHALLRTYLDDHYCLVTSVEHAVIYRRRESYPCP
jgi:hypothetical protein